MTSDNPTADRLVSDARKKTAAQESPRLATIALVVGGLGVILGSLVAAAGWVLGAIAIGLSGMSLKRGAGVKLAKIGVIVGVVAVLVGTFCFTYYVAHGSNIWLDLLAS